MAFCIILLLLRNMKWNHTYIFFLSVWLLFPAMVMANDTESRFVPPADFSDTSDIADRLRSVEMLLTDSLEHITAENSGHLIKELISAAGVYYYMCDYRSAYDLLLRALSLSEEYGYQEYQALIYANMGNIYGRFNKVDITREYYRKALGLYRDSISVMITLNNFGSLELDGGRADSAYFYLDKSLGISERLDSDYSYSIYNNLALYYQGQGDYGEAYRYFTQSLSEVRRLGRVEKEAEVLSHLGEFFLATGQIDSAFRYIGLSDDIAGKYNFRPVLMQNRFMSSQISESLGGKEDALRYYKEYSRLRDSVYNTDKFGEIYQMQRLYEISKSNRQINDLLVERRVKEKTILYQKYILVISAVILLVICTILASMFIQKRKLNLAYRRLVEKNRQIVDMQMSAEHKDESPRDTGMKSRSEPAYREGPDFQEELIRRIQEVMEDTDTICNPKFDIDRLSELVQSNRTYVSQAINDRFGKNFRSFLNGYRIREALRIFSGPDASHFTIEAIALKVGFLSRSTFRNAFSEVTGVNPGFYLKSIQNR